MSRSLQALRRSAAATQCDRCFYCSFPMWQEDRHGFARALGITEAQAQLLRCTAEHLKPRSEGGRDTAANIVAACWYCNTKRHARPRPLAPEQYRHLIQRRLASGGWLAHLIARAECAIGFESDAAERGS